MSGLGNVPNFDAWLQTAWGAGAEFWSSGWNGPGVIGLAFGQNPPYYLDDFLANYPQAFGPPTSYAGASAAAGDDEIAMPSTAGLAIGQFVQCPGMPSGTVITAVAPTAIAVNTAATVDFSDAVLVAYAAPIAPIFVIQMYINLAAASLVKCGTYGGWGDAWLVAMGWFVMHYVALYTKGAGAAFTQLTQLTTHGETPAGTLPGTVFTLSAAPPTGTLQGLYQAGKLLVPGVDYTLQGYTVTLTVATTTTLYATWAVQQTINTQVYQTPSQVAAQGLANGIMVSKSVGDVSASYQVLTSLEAWGAWNLTWFGQQLATMAKVVGAGPMLVW